MPGISNFKKKYLQSLPPIDADLLLSWSIDKSREFILIRPEYKLSLLQQARFYYALFKYRRGMPIAYITGHREFFGLDFVVNRNTLIPRPETELMVEEVIKNLESGIWNNATLIDVGTGSGCIPISIMRALEQKNIKIFATDISKRALKVARKNAKLHGVDINFLHGNLLEPILDSRFQILDSNIIITANLPYLTKAQIKNEPSIKHEPKSALIAGENGLALYRELLGQIKQLHRSLPFPRGGEEGFAVPCGHEVSTDRHACTTEGKPPLTPPWKGGGAKLTAFFEFDPRQTESITKLIKSFFPNSSLEIKKDLAGRDRLAIVSV